MTRPNQLAACAALTRCHGSAPRTLRASPGLPAMKSNRPATARRSSLIPRIGTVLPRWRVSDWRVTRLAATAVHRANASACSTAVVGSPRMSVGSSKQAVSQLSKRRKLRMRSWLTVVQRSAPDSSIVPRCHFTAARNHGSWMSPGEQP
ncbi:Uncharacterised protein [Mycobacteroides abscessus subsp. abscessus]|nr:Uncharacterised protein [Mycobacteroides abscessus subsp. abscessus]